MQRIVFGLKDVYNAQCANAGIGLTSSALELNIPGLNYGYLGGGAPGYQTVVTRIDLGTDTVSNPGNNLPQQKGYQPASFSSGNYGYWGGGYIGGGSGSSSGIARIDFTTEVISAPGNLQKSDYSYGSISGPQYGYVVGGNGLCRIERLDFTTEVVSDNPTFLPSRRNGMAGFQDSSYGYSAAGSSPSLPGLICTVSRLDFSNDSVTDIGNMSFAIWFTYGVSSSDYGYIGGGNLPSYNYESDIYRFEFSTNTSQTITANLSAEKYGVASTQSPSFGYFTGGYTTSDIYVCTIDRLDFSTETVSQPANQLPSARNAHAGVQINRPQVFKFVPGNNVWKEEPNYGYTAGGSDPSVPEHISDIQRLDFSSETTSLPGSNLVTSQKRFVSFASNTNYGYAAGGFNPSSSNVSDIERLDFSNETVVRSPTNFSRAVRASTGFSSLNYGYWHGGFDSNPASCVLERLDFSTEVRTNSTVAGLARQNSGSMFTNGYGYVAGGFSTVGINDIVKIDVSTETGQTLTSRLTEETAPATRNTCRGVSAASYGYIAGGQPDSSIIDRLDFATESITRVANLATSVAQSASMGSFGFGYVVGGNDDSNYYSLIQRLDYTTETVSSPSNNLPRTTAFAAGTASGPSGIATRRVGKATYGYFGGGRTPTVSSKVDRLDFTTETVAVPGKDLTQPRGYSIGTFSSNYGYFAAGWLPGNVCTVDRLDFSNETVAANPGGQTTIARRGAISVRNTNYSYIAGGTPPALSIDCVIERLDFSTETFSENTSALTQARRSMAGSSTPNYGYFAGGEGPTVVCTINRIEFSTETVSANASQLTQDRGYLSIGNCGNNLYGYFGGGYAPGSVCTIDRLDFSTETVTAPGTYQLTQARHELSAASSSAYGYFAGGNEPPAKSTIDRLDFASETVSLPSQKLTQARFVSAAFSNG